MVNHARYYWLMLAEVHLTRVRFAVILRWIALLRYSIRELFQPCRKRPTQPRPHHQRRKYELHATAE